MKIIKEDGIVIRKDAGTKQDACDWAQYCPRQGGKTILCRDCPANNKHTEMTYTEAVKWWEKAEIKK